MKNQEDISIYKTQKDTKVLKYKGREIVKISTEVTPHVSEQNTRDSLREMSPSRKINLKERAYPIYVACKFFGITPEQYLFSEDVMIHIANRKYDSLTEIEHNDPKTARLIKRMGLEDEVQEFLSQGQESLIG